MFNAIRETENPLRNRALLALLLDTGIRLGEVVSLKVADVSLDARQPSLTVHGKGNKWRRVPLGGSARVAVERYLTHERPTGAYVFIGRDGGMLSPRLVEKLLHRLGQRAGVTGMRVSPHSCRHSFAVAYLRAGGDIYRLSKILGHSGVQVTQHYLSDFPPDDVLRNDIDVLGGMWR
jgi:site-specific recombinase XerD